MRASPIWLDSVFQAGTAPAPPRQADPSEEKQPTANKDEPRMNTNKHKYGWTSPGGTTSWDETHQGARASRPHNSWHGLGRLLRPARSATAPGLRFGLAQAVPAVRVAGRRTAGKLSGTERECMRAGRPRSRVVSSPWRVGGAPPDSGGCLRSGIPSMSHPWVSSAGLNRNE